MVHEAIGVLTRAVNAVVGWFDTCLEGVNGAIYLIAVAFMLLAYKFILAPVLGEAGSEIAGVREQQKKARTVEQQKFAQQFKR